MSFITRMLQYDFCTYWPKVGVDNFTKAIYGSPIEIACRWVDIQEVFVSYAGRNEMSTAKVYVDQDLLAEGVLFHGTKAQVTDLHNPWKNAGCVEIRKFTNLPNIKYTESLRTCMCGIKGGAP